MSASNLVLRASAPAASVSHCPRFDYSDISPSVASFLIGRAERIRRQASSSVIGIGKDLIEAKRYLSHGAFMAWVEGEVGIPARTAQAYMRVAKWAPAKNSKIAQLPVSLLYVLAASSTPKEFAADVVKRVEAGEHISAQAIRTELRDLRELKCDEPRYRPLCRGFRGKKPSAIATVTPLTAGTALLEAVAILAHGLSEEEFARVQDIMTDKSIIHDPELARKIRDAFSALGQGSDFSAYQCSAGDVDAVCAPY